jgi:NTP pyrophosphatase (non-canonical NTP hydrolase)
MPSTEHRKPISPESVERSIEELKKNIKKRLEEKGNGSFASSHEILGIITEEYQELIQEITKHGEWKRVNVVNELMDIAVACVFGAACIESGSVDWL